MQSAVVHPCARSWVPLPRTRANHPGKSFLDAQAPACGCGRSLVSGTRFLRRRALRKVKSKASKAAGRKEVAEAGSGGLGGGGSPPPAWARDSDPEGEEVLESGADVITAVDRPVPTSSESQDGGQAVEGGKAGKGVAERAEEAARPSSSGPQPKASTSRTSSPDNWLFEPEWGVPIVRRKVKYADLLQEIRENKVAEIAYFDSNPAPEDGTSQHKERNTNLEGYCLVHYQDGLVAQAFLPPSDVRAVYAMETHGVMQTRLVGPPKPNQLNPNSGVPTFLQGKFLAGLPVFFLVAIYVSTQIAQWLKGDLKDRQKIREYEIRKEKEAKRQAEADEIAAIPNEMAEAGSSVEEICSFLDASRIPYSRDYIAKLVADAKKREEAGIKLEDLQDSSGADTEQQKRDKALAARMRRAEEEDMSEMDKAKELLKMKTVKIQQAAAPEDPAQRERRMKLRKAQSEMKGVKLQYTDDQRVIMFDDVAGIGEAKVDLTEVVDFFTQPGKFKQSGAKIPKGVLLCGPPGTGKTLLARAVAGEARVAFLSLNASELVEMFAGLGASRVRDLFSQARALAPAIIFIDEVDAVGRQRGGAKGNDERDQTLNQMLIEMDGFEDDTGVIVMAATNRLDVLDRALVRPGRFDRIIEVGLPEFEGRIEILKVHLGYRSHTDDIDYSELAFETSGFSGAQLAGLVNDAAILASRKFRDAVCMADFKQALRNEKLGNPRRGTYSQERQVRLAVQEASTALISTLLPAIEPLVSTTIVPRETWPLGQTILRVNEQRERTKLYTRRYLEEQLRTVLAGRAGEELVYGPEEMSTINQRKLEQARRIVAKLVLSGAMAGSDSRTLVPSDGSNNGTATLQLNPAEVSHATAYAADQAMQKLLNDAYRDASAMLRRNKAAFDELVARLHTRTADHDPATPFQGNTLSGDEVREVVERLGCEEDLAFRESQRAAFL